MKAICVYIGIFFVFYCRLQHLDLRRMGFDGTHFLSGGV